MSNSSKSLLELVNNLPPHFHKEVKDFVENLMQKKRSKNQYNITSRLGRSFKGL